MSHTLQFPKDAIDQDFEMTPADLTEALLLALVSEYLPGNITKVSTPDGRLSFKIEDLEIKELKTHKIRAVVNASNLTLKDMPDLTEPAKMRRPDTAPQTMADSDRWFYVAVSTDFWKRVLIPRLEGQEESLMVTSDFTERTPGMPLYTDGEHAVVHLRFLALAAAVRGIKGFWCSYEQPRLQFLNPLLDNGVHLTAEPCTLLRLQFTAATWAKMQSMGVVTASPLQTVDCWILKGDCPVAQVHCVWPICRLTYTLEACVPDTVKLIAMPPTLASDPSGPQKCSEKRARRE